MNVFYTLALTFIVSVSMIAQPIHAQVDDTGETSQEEVVTQESLESSDETIDEIKEENPEQQTQQEERSVDAQMDETVTAQDLGIEHDARILPGERFYGVKSLFRDIGRTVRKAVTIDPIKEATLELKWSNVDLHEARKALEENPENERALESVAKVVENFEEKLANIEKKADKLRERVGEDERVGIFLENVIDKQIKHQKVFEQIERRVTDSPSRGERTQQAIERVQKARDTSSERAADVITRLENNPDRLTAYFERVLDRQSGSDFKDVRNIEVLKQLEDHVPPQARDAIRRAQDNTLQRLAQRFESLPEDDREERFEHYVRDVGGDETRHLEIFDQLKQLDNVPVDLKQRAERAKDIVARRFETRFESNFGDEEFRMRHRARMLERFSESDEPDARRLRVMQDLKERVRFDDEEMKKEFEQHEEKSIEKFVQTFPDAKADAERYRELTAQMAENPSPATFRLLQELEEKVKADPKKRAFIQQMEAETKQKFVERAREHGEEFFTDIATHNPRDMEVFKKMREEFAANPEQFFGPDGDAGQFGPPPEFDRYMEDAMNKQSEMIRVHLEDIDDTEEFEYFEKRFDMPQEMIDELTRRDPAFAQTFREKRRMMEELDREEHNTGSRLDNERRTLEQEKEQQLQNAQTLEERDAVERSYERKFDEFRKQDFEKRKEFFQARLKNDPFCDTACQKEDLADFEGMLEQEQRFRKDEEDFRRTERDVYEFLEQKQYQQEGVSREPSVVDDNPFEGICGTRDECMKWCDTRRDDPRCQQAGAREAQEGVQGNRRSDLKPEFDTTLQQEQRHDVRSDSGRFEDDGTRDDRNDQRYREEIRYEDGRDEFGSGSEPGFGPQPQPQL